VGEGEGGVLELGSGAGFLKDIVRDARTSEVFWISGADLVCDARSLPVRDDSLRALVLVDVAHHVAAPRDFLREASRALRPGGRIVMIEPWVTPWSRFVYTCFHHEPFRPEAETWEFATTGPLSGANGALPWIIFERDRAMFEREHPALRIASIEPMMPFRYLLSGGVSMRALVPSWSFQFFRALERCLAPLIGHLAMFALIVVERRRVPETPQE
jgi:SAM-dependent methyltransferase